MSTRDRRVGLMQEVLSSIRMLKYMAIGSFRAIPNLCPRITQISLVHRETIRGKDPESSRRRIGSTSMELHLGRFVSPVLNLLSSLLTIDIARTVSFQAIWSISPILCVLTSFWAYTSPLLMNRTLTPSIAFASLAVWNE